MRSNTKGFTLIELMISIIILTLLLFTGSYAYSIMAERWNKEVGHFAEVMNDAKGLTLLQASMQGIVPYIIKNKENKPVIFFVGGTDSMLYVSKATINNNPSPDIYRITTKINTTGKKTLFIQQLSTKSILLNSTEQQLAFNRSIKLFDNLDKVQFTYLGYSSLLSRVSSANQIPQKFWYSIYSGIERRLLPAQIKVQLVKGAENLTFYITLNDSAESSLSSYTETF